MAGWVRLGTVNVANNSRTVTGIGTQWVGRALPGGIFVAPTGAVLEVDRIISDTELELMQPYPGPTVGNASYAIAPTQAYLPALAQQLIEVLEQFGDIRTAWLSGQLKGAPGTGLAIRGEVASVGALPTLNALGDGWFVGDDLYIWTGAAWFNAGEIKGPANVLSIGTVNTAAAGEPASATITGSAPAQVLNLVLPRGAEGGVTPQLQALLEDTQAARDTAGDHATTAAGAAGAAVTAAGQADGFADAAAQSATDAAAHKSAAQGAASSAGDAAAAASGHAVDAETSAGAAAASEGLALAHAEAAEAAAADAEQAAALVSITDITINPEGHLILTRADGSTFDAGYVMGGRGPTGASIKVKPSVDTVAELPPTGNEENDARVVRVDGHLYVWDGEGWTDAGQFQGPPGTTDYLQLLNRPTLGTAAALNVPAAAGAAAGAGQVVRGDDSRLTDARAPTAHTHTAAQISDSTATGRAVMTAADGAAARLAIGAGTSSFSGQWDDLGGKPTIPDAQVPADWNAASGPARILNKPTIPDAQVPADWSATSGPARILNKPTVLPDAPSDGKTYARQGGAWVEAGASTWEQINKPPVVAAGETKQAARASIDLDASTFVLSLLQAVDAAAFRDLIGAPADPVIGALDYLRNPATTAASLTSWLAVSGNLAAYQTLLATPERCVDMVADAHARSIVLGSGIATSHLVADASAVAAWFANAAAVTALLANTAALAELAGSETGMGVVAADSGRLNSLVSSTAGRSAIWSADTALSAIAASATAIALMRTKGRLVATTAVGASSVVVPSATSSTIMLGWSYRVGGSSTGTLNLTGRRSGSAVGNLTASIPGILGTTAEYKNVMALTANPSLLRTGSSLGTAQPAYVYLLDV